ncbi:hypothetical protein M422DRAFT_45431 [Sphaerobolus stellatus SS14]|nr:hypothetical protein M422DRAFT_45431 [Sphaerobolus stellatus SS14]
MAWTCEVSHSQKINIHSFIQISSILQYNICSAPINSGDLKIHLCCHDKAHTAIKNLLQHYSQCLSIPILADLEHMLNTVFDLWAVKHNLFLVLKEQEKISKDRRNSNKWIVNFSDWTEEMETMKLDFGAEVLCYVKVAERLTTGKMTIPFKFLLYGPVFTPPQGYYVTVPPPEDMEIPERPNKAAENFFKSTTAKKARIIQQQKQCVADDPELYLLMDVLVQCPVYFNILDHMFPVPNCPHKDDHEKKGFNGSDCRTIYGLEANMRVIGRSYMHSSTL